MNCTAPPCLLLLQDGIQHVATTGTDIITGLPEKREGSGRLSRKPAGPDGVAAPHVTGSTRGAAEGKEGKARDGSEGHERTAIPKETQLMASRNVRENVPLSLIRHSECPANHTHGSVTC